MRTRPLEYQVIRVMDTASEQAQKHGSHSTHTNTGNSPPSVESTQHNPVNTAAAVSDSNHGLNLMGSLALGS